ASERKPPHRAAVPQPSWRASRSPPAEGSSRPPPPTPSQESSARLTPPGGSPSSGIPENPLLNAAAADFMNSYWAAVGDSSGQVYRFLSAIYAPVVNYYGRPASRESILSDKFSFVARWPMRQAGTRPGER